MIPERAEPKSADLPMLIAVILFAAVILASCAPIWSGETPQAASLPAATEAVAAIAVEAARTDLPVATPTIVKPAPSTATPAPSAVPTGASAPTSPPTPTALPSPTPTGTVTNVKALTEQLIRAAEAGDTPTVQRLLKEGADINGRDAQGRTPVMAATHDNRVETVRALIQAGADVNIRDNRLDNPFLYAGAEVLLEILRLTIDAKADTKLTNRYGGTALIPAAERGHVEIVNELLTRTHVDVNHVNNLGWTALLEAIVLSNGGERHQRIVQLLVDHGANINIADKDGVTSLKHAQARGFKEIERILLRTTGAGDAVAKERDAKLIAAAKQGNVAAVKELLSQGASVHARDDKGVTALIAAAYRNDLAIADLLIRAGADVNVQDNTKQSAYLIPTADGYLELLKRTLQAGADVHSLDSYNGTGLIRAADRGHVNIIKELLKTDIKIDHVNRLGWTALLEAIILGDGGPRHTEVVRLLVEAGANLNLADGQGVTPLAHAQKRSAPPDCGNLEGRPARADHVDRHVIPSTESEDMKQRYLSIDHAFLAVEPTISPMRARMSHRFRPSLTHCLPPTWMPTAVSKPAPWHSSTRVRVCPSTPTPPTTSRPT